MVRSLLTVAVAAAAVTAANAFAPSIPSRATAVVPSRPLYAVKDVDSEAGFDAEISGAGDALVVIDYSTTWCGPCKVIAPKFDEFSETYSDSVFIKVRNTPVIQRVHKGELSGFFPLNSMFGKSVAISLICPVLKCIHIPETYFGPNIASDFHNRLSAMQHRMPPN